MPKNDFGPIVYSYTRNSAKASWRRSKLAILLMAGNDFQKFMYRYSQFSANRSWQRVNAAELIIARNDFRKTMYRYTQFVLGHDHLLMAKNDPGIPCFYYAGIVHLFFWRFKKF